MTLYALTSGRTYIN